jgi:hypothetical protein
MRQRVAVGAAGVVFAVIAASLPVAGTSGCASWAREGLDPSTMPEAVRPDYALFAQRCSKCHSLARPLSSGIDDDNYWVDYVARMRRQPASGISAEDTVGILRFLHYFSIEEKRKSGKLPPEPPAPPVTAAPVSSAPPSPSAAAPSAPVSGLPAPAQAARAAHSPSEVRKAL